MAGSAAIAVRGVITSRAVFSENSNTPASSRASSRSRLPPFALWSTSIRSSSAECRRSRRVGVRNPKILSTRFALPRSSQMNGLVATVNARSGPATQALVRSG